MRKLLFLVLLLLLVLPFVVGVKPVAQVSTNPDALQIEFPLREFVKVNTAYDMYFHIFNGSNGLPLDYSQVNCSIHLYNRSLNNHLVTATLPYDGNFDFEYKVNTSLYNELGFFTYIVWCNSSNGQGGFVKNGFFVTSDGESFPSDASGWASMVIVVLPLLVGWLLWKWGDSLSDDYSVLKFGTSLLVLVMPFVTLYFAVLVVMKFYFWSTLVVALSNTTFIYGIIFLALMLVLLILFVKSVFDRIAGRRGGDYSGD